jgi:glucokinase
MLVAAMVEPIAAVGVVAVSVGAAMNHRDGTIYASAPLWGVEATPFDLLPALRKARPEVSWILLNDVTAALNHVVTSPLARGSRKVMALTVSTGIACRIVDRRTGTVALDALGLQGEIGHLPVAFAVDGRAVSLRCDCGRVGHLSAYASGPGIRAVAGVLAAGESHPSDSGPSAGDGATFEQEFSAGVRAGDPDAHRLLSLVTKPVADIMRVALCLDPEIDLVALTGGVATGMGAAYQDAVRAHLADVGLYLTDDLAPGSTAARVVVVPEGEADPLVGAGLAALGLGIDLSTTCAAMRDS